jgi:DNA-binding transcriptional MocR family regulator
MSGLHSGRLAIIQACAIDDRRMHPAALRLLICLGTYSDAKGWCWPKQSTLALRLGISQQAVAKQIAILAELGYLEIHRQTNPETGLRGRSKYRLVLDYELPDREYRHPIQPDVVTSQPDVVPDTTPPPPDTTSEVVTVTTHVNDPLNEKPLKGKLTLEELEHHDAEWQRTQDVLRRRKGR